MEGQDDLRAPAPTIPPGTTAAATATATATAAPLGETDGAFGIFTRGAILRHVLVMTGTSTVGIMAIFVVDLLSLLYVARLGSTALTAAVGYATQVLFYAVSINIGLTIAVTALVSRALGVGDRARARRLAGSGSVCAALVSALVAAAMLGAIHPILHGLGADGDIEVVAARFLAIAMPANVPLALGMVLSGVLRATGDAKRAMYVTLAGGVVTGIVDPILIFGLHFGVYGAAMSIVLARFVIMGVGAWGVGRVHDLLERPTPGALAADLGPVLNIALPAIATNLATPVGNSYVLHVFSRFGSDAVAATTVTDRLVPVCFGVLFALSGAIGPILGQNLGARRYERVNATLSTCFVITAVYVLAIWLLLWFAAPLIIRIFDLSGDAAAYVAFFCKAGVSAWLFIGFLYVANASFNNLGFPWLSLLFNWGRATLGTIPFVTLGAAYGGVVGGQLGIAFGAAIFGIAALAATYRVSRRLAKSSHVP